MSAWLNVMLLKGKNWVRMAYLVMLIIFSPGIFFEWAEQSGAEHAMNFIALGLDVWLAKLMFTSPINTIFLKK